MLQLPFSKRAKALGLRGFSRCLPGYLELLIKSLTVSYKEPNYLFFSLLYKGELAIHLAKPRHQQSIIALLSLISPSLRRTAIASSDAGIGGLR